MRAPHAKDHFLIIDDDPVTLQRLKAHLQRISNGDIHCAADREEAEALAGCYTYSLVIANLAMNRARIEMLGLVSYLDHLPQRPGIIALAGDGTLDLETAARSKGADAVLPEACGQNELTRVISQLKSSSAPRARAGRQSPSALWTELFSDNGITTVAQPIFILDPEGARVHGVEFLSRGPAGTPFERADALFLYARRKRAEDVLDKHCIQRALRVAGKLPADWRIALNIHASTISRCPEIATWLSQTARANGIDPSRMTVEIVERSPAYHKPNLLENVRALRRQGACISLDDVGLGQSNYQMIVDLHPDSLKIDRYFVTGCQRDASRQAVIRSIKTLADKFGVITIAEGVEDEEELQTLKDLDLTYLQGYYLCTPRAVDELVELYECRGRTGIPQGTSKVPTPPCPSLTPGYPRPRPV